MVEGNKISGGQYDDGIPLSEIIRFVKSQIFWIVGIFILGGVVGFLFSYLHAREWQAMTVLQIGQIDNGLANQAPTPLDAPNRAVERVKFEPFTNQVLTKLSLPTEIGQNSTSDLIRRTLNAEVIPATDLIRLTVRGFSPDAAKASLKVAQDDLVTIHTAIFRDGVNRIHQRLDGVTADITAASARRNQVEAGRNLTAPGGESAPPVNVLLGNMLDVTDRALIEQLKKDQFDLIQQLSPERTFDTKPIADISVPQRPVTPRRSIYALVGALVGLFVGLLVAVSRHVRHR